MNIHVVVYDFDSPDPNAIVVTVDLHLDIGSRFINNVRKVRTSEMNMCLDLGPVSGKSR